MSNTIPEHSPLIQQLNRTVMSLMVLLLAQKDHQIFLTQHCILSLRSDSKFLALIDASHIHELSFQLYKHSPQLYYDFSNVLEILDGSLKNQLLTCIPNKNNLVTIVQQLFVWQLDEEAMFMDLFKLALPRLEDPNFYQQILAILANDSSIPDGFDLIVVNRHLTIGQPLDAPYYDLLILLVCTAILVAKCPHIRYLLQHSRSFEKDLEPVWNVNRLDYELTITPTEK